MSTNPQHSLSEASEVEPVTSERVRQDNDAQFESEIDLLELFQVIWRGKWIIASLVLVTSILVALYSFSLPNIYRATGVFAATKDDSKGLSGLSSQYGGLAAMAGLSLGASDGGEIQRAMRVITSWPFLESVVEKHQLKPLVLAVDHWDQVKGEVVFDRKKYIRSSNEWVIAGLKENSEPGSYEVYKKLVASISVEMDSKSGMIVIGVEHQSPEVAYSWVNILVREVNQHFQAKDIKEANANIQYLQDKVEHTSVADMRTVFYGMIESETKKLMLAEVSDEYLLETVVPPKTPEEKVGPKRLLILILAAFVSGVLGAIVVLVRHFLGKSA